MYSCQIVRACLLNMPLVDSPEFRAVLSHFFPGIQFEANLRPSGQRLVYFCHFSGHTELPTQKAWSDWGHVALKVAEDVHPTVIARLEKERELLNALDSPYFPRLLHSDVFSTDPVTEEKLRYRLFVTIEERVNGSPLSDCRTQFNCERQCLKLLSRLNEGLQLLWDHPQRIVHRDLKPDNVLIRRDGSPVVIDLGIVREEGSVGVTVSHAHIGPCTPAYASPEQIRNEKRLITFKTDFFALAVIAYELLSGRNPFVEHEHEPMEVVINRVLTHEPPTLADLGRATPAFSALIARMMAKQPYMRPRTVADLTRELATMVSRS